MWSGVIADHFGCTWVAELFKPHLVDTSTKCGGIISWGSESDQS
jgi:hypothetical protein